MAFGADVGSGTGAAQTDMGPNDFALVIPLATEESPDWPPVDSTQRDFAVRIRFEKNNVRQSHVVARRYECGAAAIEDNVENAYGPKVRL